MPLPGQGRKPPCGFLLPSGQQGQRWHTTLETPLLKMSDLLQSGSLDHLLEQDPPPPIIYHILTTWDCYYSNQTLPLYLSITYGGLFVTAAQSILIQGHSIVLD